MTQLPTLYKQNKTGTTQVCNISHSNDTFTVEFGQLDGKMQTKTNKCYVTNAGRANERTPEQQAKFEAEAKHASKIKSGYVLDISGNVEVLLPQKVKVYQDHKSKVTFPCYSTPKLNGVNGTYWLLEDGTLKLTSRGGGEYPRIPHLEAEVKHLMQTLKTTCLNGELYIHRELLQDITSAVKKPKPLSTKLEFAVFEGPYLDGGYKDRRSQLIKAYQSLVFPEDSYVTILPGIECTSQEDLESHYNQCISSGLEGTVIYLPEAPYEFNTRSSYAFKYKKAKDSEFLIRSYTLDKNNHPVFNCESHREDKRIFKAKPKGTNEQRLQIVKDFDTLYKDQWYTVEFEMLSKDQIPQKPVGIGLRNCGTNGNPLA